MPVSADQPRGDASSNSGAGDGDDATLLVLPIDRIRAYDGNPRHSKNPEYARIKASIRAEGMDQPLIVTQRPGEPAYMTHAGGNTRLQILHELYEETGEARFCQVTCLYRPWTHEADTLLAHLRENDLRGSLTFLDKALAVHEARRLIEVENEKPPLTQGRLSQVLGERGYALSQGLISQMAYAAERLLPLIPNALNSGMGKDQVGRLRQLERVSRSVWSDRSVDTEAEFDETFAILCRRFDDSQWDSHRLRRALEAEIADRLEISIHAVNLEFERRLSAGQGTSPGNYADSPTEVSEPADPSAPQRDETKPKQAEADATERHAKPAKDEHLESSTRQGSALPESPAGEESENSEESDVEPGEDDGDDEAEVAATETPHGSSDTKTQPRPSDLKSLRARAWTLASRLAQRNGLSELIQPLSGKGLGFLLRDVPDPALVDHLDEDALAQVSMIWWHLAAAAELTVAPLEPLLSELPEESVLRRALEDQDAGLLFSSVWTLDPGHMGFRLWRRLDERDWRDLVDLMENYRALYQAAEASGVALWP